MRLLLPWQRSWAGDQILPRGERDRDRVRAGAGRLRAGRYRELKTSKKKINDSTAWGQKERPVQSTLFGPCRT